MGNATLDSLVTETGTEVTYHSDGYRSRRPAINVKHWINPPEDKPVGNGDTATIASLRAELGESWLGDGDYENGALYYATEQAQRDWWEQAAEAAKSFGLGPIEQEGRSGGWLVFTDGRDPEDMAYEIEGAEKDIAANTVGDPESAADYERDLEQSRSALREWLAGYEKMVQWCKATINGGEVPEYMDRTPFTVDGKTFDGTPGDWTVGPYTSEGIDADVLFRLSDLAEQERERRAETLATRTFTEKSLREAIERYWGPETSGAHMAAAIFGGDDHAMSVILGKHHDWTEADERAAKAVQS